MWAGPDRWYESFVEGAMQWARWKTEKGLFEPAGQRGNVGYPASLVLQQIRDPLHAGSDVPATPLYLGSETFGSMTLSCFRSSPILPPAFQGLPRTQQYFERFCTVPGKPVLLLEQSSYTVYFEQSAVFQHKIVARKILVRDDGDSVVDIDVDALHSPDARQMGELEPPSDAVAAPGDLSPISAAEAASRTTRETAPRYPEEAKQKREQGTVRLAGTIGTTGAITITGVLHSPAPELTRAAEEAVKQWTYSPRMRDGKPVEVQTTVYVRFTLGR